MKSIILEGFDGCGKSTLARALGEYYQVGVHSIGGPPTNDVSAENMARLQSIIARESAVIFDRVTTISRLCYEEGVTNGHAKYLLDSFQLMKRYCVLIWVKSDHPVHSIKDHDTPEFIDNITRRRYDILNEYRDTMESMDHIKYDYSISSFEDLIVQIDQEM